METERSRRAHPTHPTSADICDSPDGKHLCPVLAAVGVIGTEWRLAIVHRLLEGPQRFSEILKSNPRLNAKTLSATLKFLEGQGVVQRTVVSTRPFSVVYSLTEMGLGLAPAARELRLWGERWLLPRTAQTSRAATPAAHRPPTIQGELPRIVVGEAEPHRAR
ncbi:MAG TPA: helix-turn-helix domain-containing protein [Thermoplasmata archaeon]|jgi:DNA-binding HxlR family transcriptional regulator|nr:helix-turn-helix domain-containing protein [Thermoplasmata archaeon]